MTSLLTDKFGKPLKPKWRRLSELPIMETILAAEDKHGITTHMVLEAKHIKDDDETAEEDPYENEVTWIVEFEYENRVFDNFTDAKNFLLKQAVATGNGPKVEIDYGDEEDA